MRVQFNNLKAGLTKAIEVSSSDYIIDCGANVGDVTESFLSLGANVIAFEPNEYAYEKLKERFSTKDRVTLIKKGVSGIKSAGYAQLFLHEHHERDKVHYSNGSSIVEDKNNVSADNFLMIELVNLCAFIKDLDKRVVILKIDIEGAEAELLHDLMDTGIARQIPHIFVETHEKKVPSIRESIEKLRFRIKNENYHNINLNWI
jgi:FkbM family methyltransferase